jgi:predicted RNase H-like nuclease (RuvC/YqgF family)
LALDVYWSARYALRWLQFGVQEMTEIQGTKDYVALYRDESGTVVHTENANGEYREMTTQIEKLRQALQIEMERVEDLRELLDRTRKVILEQDRKILTGGV